jgi:nitrite reductase/ring-hydroxylating ferredoxin subunit
MADITNETPAPCEQLPRRTFFQRAFLGLTVIVGLLAAGFLVVPLVLYFMGPIRKRTAPWVSLGPISRFPRGETLFTKFVNPLGQGWDGVTGHNAVYVRYLGKDGEGKDSFLVFSVNCAHLGCPVTWFPQSGLFMCPCHGGVYYENGERASGPPPRGLYHCVWQVEDGELKIQAPHYPTLQNTLKA